MSLSPDYSIIVPVLNEAKAIGNILDLLKGLTLESYEIIVVDGGSSDGSLEIINENKDELISVIQNKGGYVSSLLEGSKIARGDIIIWMDGDSTYDPNEIYNLINAIKTNKVDYVIGSRFKGKIMPSSISVYKKIGNMLINLLFNLLFGEKFTDLASGFRAMKKEIILSQKVILNSHDELIYHNALSKKMGYIVEEVPITFYPRYSKPKLSTITHGVKIIFNMFKLLFIKFPPKKSETL